MSDVEALDWLDRLLAADEVDRAASLDSLAARDPALHARLQRLLATALAPDTLTDLGGGACFNDARVQVEAASTLH